MRDLGKPLQLGEPARDWLDSVRASIFAADKTIIAIATEVAGLVRNDVLGELGSAVDLSKPGNLTEADAVHAVNRLAAEGFLEIRWRPAVKMTTPFALRRPGDNPGAVRIAQRKSPAPEQAEAEAIAASAVRNMSLSDSVAVLIGALARCCAAAHVDPDRASGVDLITTINKLLETRIREAAQTECEGE